MWLLSIIVACVFLVAQGQYLSTLPSEFDNAAASWAFISYTNPTAAVINGPFNRTIFQAPWAGQTSDTALQQA